MRLVSLLGSVTQPGRLRGAVVAAVDRAQDADVEVELLDLAGLRIGFADGRPPEAFGDDTARTVAAIAEADAVIVATPVYRASLTGALKNLFDHLPVEALENKAVGLISMGARDHHCLGADRHLRDVLSFFGALVAPVAVYLTSADFSNGIASAQANTDLDALFNRVIALAASSAVPEGPVLRPLVVRTGR